MTVHIVFEHQIIRQFNRIFQSHGKNKYESDAKLLDGKLKLDTKLFAVSTPTHASVPLYVKIKE